MMLGHKSKMHKRPDDASLKAPAVLLHDETESTHPTSKLQQTAQNMPISKTTTLRVILNITELLKIRQGLCRN